MNENIFEKLMTIARDEFNVTLLKVEKSETSTALMNELKERLNELQTCREDL